MGWARQAVRIGPQWGYLDEDGDLTIETEFTAAEDFDPETERANVTYRTKRTQETGDVYSIGLDGKNRKLEIKGTPKVESAEDPQQEKIETEGDTDKAPEEKFNLDDAADGLDDE